MTHDEAYPRLAELVRVRAADVDESALRTHLSSCARCATRLRELERVERILCSRRTATGRIYRGSVLQSACSRSRR